MVKNISFKYSTKRASFIKLPVGAKNESLIEFTANFRIAVGGHHSKLDKTDFHQILAKLKLVKSSIKMDSKFR